ncbi:carboxymuconolactone decarboxylase family protein [Halomonas sp. M4R1S46]|uniref:carboxymuconolactone decarboxylase family protein n=1 Tax=Halomonas sp. M4R1S46 TaxID=2982692 RepID=UPI0021E46FE7|nr:carboxymuconolactone decarboxylase family protein [Halomonas sp. M4R1S46]UYG09125.1 carboxymuconolactone decarboxylase family protein [Halomonas sp. M4R1S46]
MSYIETIAPEVAEGEVLALYQRQQAHFGYLPNYARVFSHRPDVMASWASLLATIRRHVAPRRFELVTLASAQALGNSYCALAHARALGELLGMDAARDVVAGEASSLSDVEHAIMAFARKVACQAPAVTAEDIEGLREQGLADDEIFDIVAVAAARAFFTRILDGLGAEPDAAYRELPEPLREALTVGRPIARPATGAAEQALSGSGR